MIQFDNETEIVPNGALLRQIRLAHEVKGKGKKGDEFTLDEVSAATGISSSTLCEIESGRRVNTNIRTLGKLAKLYSTPDWTCKIDDLIIEIPEAEFNAITNRLKKPEVFKSYSSFVYQQERHTTINRKRVFTYGFIDTFSESWKEEMAEALNAIPEPVKKAPLVTRQLSING